MIFILFLFTLVSCNSNPLGETKISSCDHSPNFKTGLPITCQVNLKNLENLRIWLDANDSGTITSTNQTEVDSWSDKSGNGAVFSSTLVKASLLKKQINGRTAIRWTSDTTEYSSSPLTNFDEEQSFTLALAFKVRPSNSDKLRLTNNSNDGLELLISKDGLISISLNEEEPYISDFRVLDETVYKLIIVYSASKKTLLIYDDLELAGRHTFTENSAAWNSLSFSGSEGLELNEVLIYNEIKSNFEITEIQTYLNNKWGF